MYSFSEKPNRLLLRVWYIAIALSAMVFILSVGFAYSSRTILSWNMWQAPVAVMCNAFVGGPLLTMTSYACAGCRFLSRRKGMQLLAISVVALLVNAIVYALQICDVLAMSNSLVSVAELVPAYWLAFAAFVVLVVAAHVLAWKMIQKLPRDPEEEVQVVTSR